MFNLQLRVHGVMDRATRDALRRFQEEQGILADGIAGPETEKALVEARAKRAGGTNGLSSAWEDLEALDLDLTDLEWEGEVNRNSQEYIRWVQSSLNRIMGLRLAVDGISGPKTRSAIRDFQQQHGAAVDGIVGPETERSLIAAGAGNPPGMGAPSYTPPSSSLPPSSTSSRAQLAQQILNNSRITLGTSSSTPSGNPRQNMLDTANGLPAKSGCYDFSKCESTVYLSPKVLQALLTMANQGNSFYVTSFAGGRHGSGSDHYAGRAVDIGIWNGTSLSSPNSAHTAARDALIAAGANPSQTFNAYHDTKDGGHKNHVHAAFY
jgi:peptidoglycan hydrolase-like protein with peptidoglycan-binding domain